MKVIHGSWNLTALSTHFLFRFHCFVPAWCTTLHRRIDGDWSCKVAEKRRHWPYFTILCHNSRKRSVTSELQWQGNHKWIPSNISHYTMGVCWVKFLLDLMSMMLAHSCLSWQKTATKRGQECGWITSEVAFMFRHLNPFFVIPHVLSFVGISVWHAGSKGWRENFSFSHLGTRNSCPQFRSQLHDQCSKLTHAWHRFLFHKKISSVSSFKSIYIKDIKSDKFFLTPNCASVAAHCYAWFVQPLVVLPCLRVFHSSFHSFILLDLLACIILHHPTNWTRPSFHMYHSPKSL